jgi:hypothetical protein
MEYIMILAFLVLVGMQNMICVIVGIKVGMALSKGEKLELPNPVKVYKEHKASEEARLEAEKELDKISTIMQNIENYDGTGSNQEEVPRW